MSSEQPIIVIGAGGHAKVLVDALQRAGRVIEGMIDIEPTRWGTSVLGVKVLGGDDILQRFPPDRVVLANGVGSVKTLQGRVGAFERYAEAGYRFCTIVHPAACVATSAILEPGCQIMAGAVVQPDCRIGRNSIVNTRASVDHDCTIGEHAHIAPGVTLSGGVRIGARTHVGTAACLIQGVSVGSGCLVAAGTVVTRDVPDATAVRGSPARCIPWKGSSGS